MNGSRKCCQIESVAKWFNFKFQKVSLNEDLMILKQFSLYKMISKQINFEIFSESYFFVCFASVKSILSNWFYSIFQTVSS